MRLFPESGAAGAWPAEDRLADLLVAEATEGLSPAEQAELEHLLRNAEAAGPAGVESPGSSRGRDGIALAAASANLAMVHGEEASLDPSLRDKLLAGAAGYFAGTRSVEVAGRIGPRGGAAGAWAGRVGWAWLAAAAAVVLAVTGWLSVVAVADRGGSVAVAQTAEEMRAAVLASEDAERRPWKGLVDGYTQVSGEVVWSRSKQQGVMVLRGLPANAPNRSQYQLWVVDPVRAEQPVDGGVFDVTAAGEVLVPFTPKLPVDRVAVFAITSEKPGGVVVSRGPLLVVAGG
ncbi:MAG: anti-sigma factor [Planctomycetaceae bacterium]|nr:anti-sigma factor [Planctomycetaceae bacterium]